MKSIPSAMDADASLAREIALVLVDDAEERDVIP
jgi:hypothetical protein